MQITEKLLRRIWLVLFWVTSPAMGFAQGSPVISSDTMRDTGVSGIWVLANISYAGMRAQGSESTGWRIVAFIFGFPGTVVTLLVVGNGSGRAYGIELPGRRNETDR